MTPFCVGRITRTSERWLVRIGDDVWCHWWIAATAPASGPTRSESEMGTRTPNHLVPNHMGTEG